jgi:hypothetical protein
LRSVIGTNNAPLGDRFSIAYDFKFGYNYKIEINCYTPTQSGTPHYPFLTHEFTNVNQFANNCSGPEVEAGTSQHSPNVGSYSVISFEYALNTAYSLISIGSHPSTDQTVQASIFIKSIKIL